MRKAIATTWLLGFILFGMTACKKKSRPEGKYQFNSSKIIEINEVKLNPDTALIFKNQAIVINDSTLFASLIETHKNIAQLSAQENISQKDFIKFSYTLVSRDENLFGCNVRCYFIDLEDNLTGYTISVQPTFERMCFPKRSNQLMILIKTYKIFDNPVSIVLKKAKHVL